MSSQNASAAWGSLEKVQTLLKCMFTLGSNNIASRVVKCFWSWVRKNVCLADSTVGIQDFLSPVFALLPFIDYYYQASQSQQFHIAPNLASPAPLRAHTRTVCRSNHRPCLPHLRFPAQPHQSTRIDRVWRYGYHMPRVCVCVRCQFPIHEANQDREDDALRLARVNGCDWAIAILLACFLT